MVSSVSDPSDVKTTMNITITESSHRFTKAGYCANQIVPDAIWGARVYAGDDLCGGDPYLHGVRFHGVMNRIKDRGPLSPQERQYLPHLGALRDELRHRGVSYITPEVTLNAGAGATRRCDLLLKGGLSPTGICEVKCVTNLPDQVRIADFLQLELYARLHANEHPATRIWGCVAYVSIKAKAIRIFAFREVVGRRFGAYNQ